MQRERDILSKSNADLKAAAAGIKYKEKEKAFSLKSDLTSAQSSLLEKRRLSKVGVGTSQEVNGARGGASVVLLASCLLALVIGLAIGKFLL